MSTNARVVSLTILVGPKIQLYIATVVVGKQRHQLAGCIKAGILETKNKSFLSYSSTKALVCVYNLPVAFRLQLIQVEGTVLCL